MSASTSFSQVEHVSKPEKTSRLSLVVVALLLPALLALCAVVPPFQSPDEVDHFKRGYMLSRGQLTLHTSGPYDSGGMIDASVEALIAVYSNLPGNREARIDANDRLKASSVTWTGKEIFSTAPGTSYYFPLIYLPSAAGVFLGKLTDASVLKTYYFSRIFSILAFVTILWFSFQIYSPPPLALTILALPITLFQAISTSIDGLSLALMILACSIFAHVMKAGVLHARFAITLLGCCLIVATSRPHMLCLLILPFAIPRARVQNPRVLLSGSLVTTLTAVIWLAFALATTVDTRVKRSISTAESVKYYISHPFTFLDLISKTVAVHSDNFWTGFVGYLGWLDTPLRDSIYHMWLIVIGAVGIVTLAWFLRCLIHTKDRHAIAVQLTVFVLVALSGALLVFFLLLCTWTPSLPTALIEGVQGRYFSLPAAALAYATAVPLLTTPKWLRLSLATLLLTAAGISLIAMTETLISRYYI